MLTPNEAKVLALIEEKTFRTSKLATLMGISRSTVASLISSLMRNISSYADELIF